MNRLVSVTLNEQTLHVPPEMVDELREASSPIARLFGIRNEDEAQVRLATEREIARIFAALEAIDRTQAGA